MTLTAGEKRTACKGEGCDHPDHMPYTPAIDRDDPGGFGRRVARGCFAWAVGWHYEPTG